ncbi:hypothetical protein DUI87_00610 [Hirundo rustica rustica]|uniref:Uncharacterized protein n=1 Tax=Hirundo rustica rustica TaxID=333673 RepID=A0A3M0LA76_HIRRU|nr:hypothetical protein DUI87_00610 [Hirundo rustica rustica]
MAGSRARWTVLRRQGCPRQAEVAVPEKPQRRDPVSPKIQQDSEENSEFLGTPTHGRIPRTRLLRYPWTPAASSRLIRAPRKTESYEAALVFSIIININVAVIIIIIIIIII